MAKDDGQKLADDIASDGVGRLPGFEPVGIVDIGSNSVRLVIYDASRRSPTPVFNEKVLCGLGRGLATTGRMDPENIDSALSALSRFQALNAQIGVKEVHAVATAAAREASNGPDFIKQAQDRLGAEIKVLTGKREARLAAYGVLAGIPDADGLVGDLGGGSLELIHVKGGKIKNGVTLPLGALRLIDMVGTSRLKARKLIDQALEELDVLDGLENRDFYAVGGTWRNLAKLHMAQKNYPLAVVHQYQIPRQEMRSLSQLIARQSAGSLNKMAVISKNREETLPLGAEVMSRLLNRTKVRNVVLSAYGVREGLLYSKLHLEVRKSDPLLSSARDLARLRSRSLKHAEELCEWTDHLMKSTGLGETKHQRRLRHAACYMADIGWRADQDYRGEQSLNIIANAAMGGVSHADRAFLALTVYYRYGGSASRASSPRLQELMEGDMIARARILAAAQRLAYVFSGAMPGLLLDIKLKLVVSELRLKIPEEHAALWGNRIIRRFNDLAKEFKAVPVARIGVRKI